MLPDDNPLADELNALFEKAHSLDSESIPESRKNIPVDELDIAIRFANVCHNANIDTIWDLVNISEEMRKRIPYFRCRVRTGEVLYALKQAIALLTDTANPEDSKQVSDTPLTPPTSRGVRHL
jgi:DNA-directed RNA polymerase alpha subunit